MNTEQTVLYREFIERQVRNLVREPMGNVVDFVLLNDKDKLIAFKAWSVEQLVKTDNQIGNLPAEERKLQDKKALLESMDGLS